MSTIEEFLHQALNEAELREVCAAYFPELQGMLAEEGLNHEEKATAVWRHIQAQQAEAKLITALQARFPQKIKAAFPDGLHPPPPTPDEVAIEWRERLPRPVLLGLGIGLLTTLLLALIISNMTPPLPPPDPYAPTPETDEILTASGPILAGQTAVGKWNNTGRATFGFGDGPGQFDFVVEIVGATFITATGELSATVDPALILFDAANPTVPLFEIDFRTDGLEEWRYVNFGDGRAYQLVVVGEPGQEFALTVTNSWPQPIWLGEEVTGLLEGVNPAVYALRDAPAQINLRLSMDNPTTSQPLLYLLDENWQELGRFDQPDHNGDITLTNFALPAEQTIRFVVRDTANNGVGFRLLIEGAGE